MKVLIVLLYHIFLGFLTMITIPLILIIGLVIAVIDGLPIFYRQKRVGVVGNHFTLVKFRTMSKDADKLQKKYRSQNEADGPVFKVRNDPRFTRLGKFLSHTGLDELPQLYNILRGEMALFGPRPLPVNEVQKLTNLQKRRHSIRPGIISPWIINGYHKNSFAKWMQSDLEYVKNKSLFCDAWLLLKTAHFMARIIFIEVKELIIK